ncbi:Uncharacterised protein [Mycobacteroides abscessus]|nr:Uncharacterised protein [Mycobacteroides abscessus]
MMVHVLMVNGFYHSMQYNMVLRNLVLNVYKSLLMGYILL